MTRNLKGGEEALNRLLDKLVILVICMMNFSLSDNFIVPVAALLASVGASCAIQLLSGRKAASAIILLCCAMCGAVPMFFCALPLMLYDALCEKRWWLVLPSAAVFVRLDQLMPAQFIISAAGMLAASVIYLRVSKLEKTVSKLMELRNEMTEKNSLLTRQNLRLAQAQDNEVRLATLKERNRIAREIHDNVGHMLTRSLLQSGALLIINKDDTMKEPLESLKATLDNAMTSIRESVHDLHDDSIDLKKSVEESISHAKNRFDVALDYDMSDSVPGRIKLCFAGIVKEGISNAVKHSNGDSIRLVLREHPGFYQLMIEDNGSSAEITESGIGLKNMSDRAESVGGMISFNADKNGFSVFMSVPKIQEEVE